MEDLSFNTFLICFRRFAARRGTPSLIVSDNAKTFKSAATFMEKLSKDETFLSVLSGERVEWRFNLEHTPWWGGFFERMVGTVKRCLRKLIGNARLSFDELNTFLVEVEGTVNARPLTYLYEEPSSEPLTPSHLMYGRRIITLPDAVCFDIDNETTKLSMRYKYLLTKFAHFWNRWKKEYLADLREYKTIDQGYRTVKVGNVVLLYEDNTKRLLWKLGKIERLIRGKDGNVRGAKVQVITRNKLETLSRPVQKLYPLEVRDERREGYAEG